MTDEWSLLQLLRTQAGCKLPCEDPGACSCLMQLEALEGTNLHLCITMTDSICHFPTEEK